MDKIVLVTGANRGLGLEFTKQLLHKKYRVVASARKPSHELTQLVEQHPNLCEFHTVDVTSRESLKTLGTFLKTLSHLDWVICNAGIMGPAKANNFDCSSDDYLEVFKTNVLGPLEIAKTCMPRLLESKKPILASITSLMGSIHDNTSGGYGPYRVSKAALNMLNKNLSIEFGKVACVVLHPGWVQTDMGGKQAPLKPHDSIAGMLEVLEKLSLKDSGKFFNYSGKELPW